MKLSTLFLAFATIISTVSNDLLRDTLVLKSPQRLATEVIFSNTKYVLKLKFCCLPLKQLAERPQQQFEYFSTFSIKVKFDLQGGVFE